MRTIRWHSFIPTLFAPLLCVVWFAGGTRSMASGDSVLSQRDVTIYQRWLSGAPNSVVVIGRLTPPGGRAVQVYPQRASGVTGHSVFEAGSVTKIFTALLLADMVRRNEVHLDDPIQMYLPKGVTAPAYEGHQITLLDLAVHDSGLPRMPPNADFDPTAIERYTATQMYAGLSSYKLTREPGSKYEYSNWGGGLLGQLLANRANTSYAELVAKRIIEPLGLHSTWVPAPFASPGALVQGFDNDGNPQPALTWGDSLAGAGAIRSTVDDLLTFGAACLSNAAGPVAEDCRLAMIPRAPSGDPKAQVGLFWEIENDGIVWHNGDTFGYHGFVGVDATRRTVVVTLSNTSFLTDRVAFELLNPSRVPDVPPTPMPLPAGLLAQYAGQYRLGDGTGVVVTIKNDADELRMIVPGKGHYVLRPTANDSFVTHEHVTVTFSTRADGTAYALVRAGLGKTDVAMRVVQSN